MNGRDLIGIAAGNLWRMKLRSFLTVSGVLVAIGAFVAMLSFGAGNQRLVQQQWRELGLFTTMQVFPADAGEAEADSGAVLDATAVRELAALPGVRLAYPFDTFDVRVTVADSSLDTKAQALPPTVLQTRRFSRMRAGRAWTGEGDGEVLVTSEFVDMLELESPDSLVGKRLALSIQVASVDSGLARIFAGETRHPMEIFGSLRLDSIMHPEYQQRLLRKEAAPVLSRFVRGFMSGATISDTLTISGVVAGRSHGRLHLEPIVIPVSTAARFSGAGLSNDPMTLFRAVSQGELPLFGGADSAQSYPKITLDLESDADHAALADSIAARGFTSFSFVDELKEIQRVFFYFDLMLGAIGMVALVIAALGIANTMIMSVSERRREIGILKSLGADLRDIRLLFLVESALIGVLGAALGVLLGWTVSRVASLVAKGFMAREGIDSVEFFATPFWLVITAILFGVGVSVLAGSLPAARAAKVDPVAALRND